MDILLGGAYLAKESSGYPPEGFECNGVRVVEAVDLARALNKALYPRGNNLFTLRFTTATAFPTQREAQLAAILSLPAAPISGPLEIRCGGPGEVVQSVFFANAVVQSIPGTIVGCMASLAWTILATTPSTTIPPGFTIDPDAVLTMAAKIAIAQGAQSVAVNFPAATPNPIISGLVVEVPAGLDALAVVGVGNVSENGFVAYLSGPAPAAGYFLHWKATPGPDA